MWFPDSLALRSSPIKYRIGTERRLARETPLPSQNDDHPMHVPRAADQLSRPDRCNSFSTRDDSSRIIRYSAAR